MVVPHWPGQAWFPVYTEMCEREPIIFNPNIVLLRSSNRNSHPFWSQLSLVAGILSNKHSYLREISRETIEIMMSSIGESWRQYEEAFKKWWKFCEENGINTLTASIPDVLRFLTDEFHKGASYGSINIYRSDQQSD